MKDFRTYSNINDIEQRLEKLGTSLGLDERRQRMLDSEDFGGDQRSVLGIDILGYSQYRAPEQDFVPILFHMLFLKAIKDVLIYEYLIFQNHTEKTIKERYIPTGDGGFIIFENPLESILFALYFESYLRDYNSGGRHEAIFEYIGPVKVRYAVTYDEIYRVLDPKNFFGTGIINCARIMAKDKLDRCLLDENTYKWFLKHTNGLESLRNTPIDKLLTLEPFTDLKNAEIPENRYASYAFPNNRSRHEPGVDLIIVMKVGTIQVKATEISIYNAFLQMPYMYASNASEPESYYVVSLGNNNADGLLT